MVRTVLKAWAVTFRQWRYVLLALTVAAVLLLVAVWLSNWPFLTYLFSDPRFSWGTRFAIIAGSLEVLRLNSTPVSRTILGALVALAGMNVSLLTYYMTRRFAVARQAGMSLLATILGVVGVGCASCGSVVLSSIFGLSATAGFLAVLPLRGLEFGLVGIALLAVANIMVAKKIADPLACPR